MTYIHYEHHGAEVWARSDLKGTHREHCLCYACAKFHPGAAHNCPLAQELFHFCVRNSMATPVFECAVFEEKME